MQPNGMVNENPKVFSKCESRVLEAQTLNECESKCCTPMGCSGPLVVKVPVVLSNVKIQIDLEAKIQLNKEALDIKTIDKHVFITQCKLVPHTNKLFLEGYIQKNIQFSTIDCTDKNTIGGKIQHSTVKIFFNCVTEIKLFKKPFYGKEEKKRSNVLDKNMLGIDTKEESWVHYSKFQEEVFCELESSRILETDILNRHTSSCKDLGEEKGFKEIEEKMVLFLKLKILQKQKVFVPKYEGGIDSIEENESNNSKEINRNISHIEIGQNAEKGIIGREVSDYNLYEE